MGLNAYTDFVKNTGGGSFKVKWGVKLVFKGQVKIIVLSVSLICLYHAHAGYT